MNKWKTAFWICFITLIFVTIISVYSIVDQAVTITYQNDSFTKSENDLEKLIELINKTDLTKNEIEKELKRHKLYEYMNFKTDTISLERIELIFKNNKLLRKINSIKHKSSLQRCYTKIILNDFQKHPYRKLQMAFNLFVNRATFWISFGLFFSFIRMGDPI